MTTTEIAVAEQSAPPVTRAAVRSEIALAPDQTKFTPQQVAALRQLGIEDASEGDLQVFHHVCQTTGLDPFRKQIYMIGRRTKVKYWDESQRRQVEDWVMKWTIQTGIDGFRRNGREAAKREGEVIRVDGPYWKAADGGDWQDVWLDPKNPPAAAKFTIFRGGEAHVGVAMYSEFVQTNADGSPNSMWRKMPANQTAKCAEAQAWRRAYPDDFAGVQLEDAVQAINPDGSPVAPVHATAERVNAADVLAEGRQTDPAPAADEDTMSSLAEQRRLGAQLDRHGRRTVDEKLAWLSKRLGRMIGTAADLTGVEARTVANELAAMVPGALDEPASNEGAKPDTAQVDAAPGWWADAAQMLDQLGADTDDKKILFLRTFLKRDDIPGPHALTDAEAADVLAELSVLIADEAQSNARDTVAEALGPTSVPNAGE
ncbi:recombinase RecT [Nocardia brasiliensis]|uniref:recombinase RecT n=1 Tax=Nocardia brasiliensis TaxID=37326 RepID=UPI00068B0D8C|nr:recombinase RecT [Nocardia brasiliensis]